jgi:uncharacterized protein YjbJ (UPF0337 family)
MSGGSYPGRDAEGLNAGTTGSASLGDRQGTAEVHSGLHSGRTGGEYEGIAFAGGETSGGVAGRVRDAAGTVADRASDLGGRAKEAAGTVAGRAGDLASQARERVSGVAGRAQGVLEERGVLNKVRDNALPALGLAFGVGFMLALSDNRRVRPGSRMDRAKHELRGAIVAGLSAGAAQAAHQFLGQAGAPDGFVNSLLRNLTGQGGGSAGRTGGTPRAGGSGGGTGGEGYEVSRSGGGFEVSRGGGTSTGGAGGYGATGRTSGTPGMSGGGTSGAPHREPSHRENL